MTQILVIDDESAVLRNLALILELEGHEVKLAGNGVEGLARIREQAPRLVVCDLAMPDMSGLDVLHMLKSDPATRHIPVVMITGVRDQEVAHNLLAGGAAGILYKPFTRAQVLQMVSQHVQP